MQANMLNQKARQAVSSPAAAVPCQPTRSRLASVQMACHTYSSAAPKVVAPFNSARTDHLRNVRAFSQPSGGAQFSERLQTVLKEIDAVNMQDPRTAEASCSLFKLLETCR